MISMVGAVSRGSARARHSLTWGFFSMSGHAREADVARPRTERLRRVENGHWDQVTRAHLVQEQTQ